jgi:anti-sigma regulatory factor (Ser/Thr protein kinase)
MEEAGSTGVALRHFASFYRTADEYVAAVTDFLLAGNAAAEPALVAVPGDKQAQLRPALESRLTSCATTIFADMSELGRNPGRIIPTIRSFIDSCAGMRIRLVGEPIWPGRSVAEMREATRHEALINLAFADAPAAIMCPYDAARLPGSVIADARRTHPLLADGDSEKPNPRFAGPGSVPEDCDGPLPTVPVRASVMTYRQNLREVRDLIAGQARLAGLSRARAVDFVLAVSEVAANTLRHTLADGTISLWCTPTELICQLRDSGHIADPLAGRRIPDHDHPGGQGLWLVNQVCDLVELRTGETGTVIRLHMGLKPAARQELLTARPSA